MVVGEGLEPPARGLSVYRTPTRTLKPWSPSKPSTSRFSSPFNLENLPLMLVVIDSASMLNVSFSPLGVRFFVSGVSQGREHVHGQRLPPSEREGLAGRRALQGRGRLAQHHEVAPRCQEQGRGHTHGPRLGDRAERQQRRHGTRGRLRGGLHRPQGGAPLDTALHGNGLQEEPERLAAVPGRP